MGSTRASRTTTSPAPSGISASSAASNTFVARNTVFTSFAAEYNMSAGTKYGPIITADGDLSTITNADHPWANFVY